MRLSHRPARVNPAGGGSLAGMQGIQGIEDFRKENVEHRISNIEDASLRMAQGRL
jgi:hypothetical protein